MPVPSHRFVVLKRVSTQKQGADGLGIAAQQRDIQLFMDQQPNATVIKELVEVQSGGKELNDRPVLQEAMDLCRQTNSTLLVAKLSRLTRDGICPDLDEGQHHPFQGCVHARCRQLSVGIYALLDEQEKRQVVTTN